MRSTPCVLMVRLSPSVVGYLVDKFGFLKMGAEFTMQHSSSYIDCPARLIESTLHLPERATDPEMSSIESLVEISCYSLPLVRGYDLLPLGLTNLGMKSATV